MTTDREATRASVGHVVFAATLIALGVTCLIAPNLAPVWQPPDTVPGRAALVDACAVVSLASGIGLLWRRTAATAAGGFLGYLVLWTLVFRTYDIIAAPTEFGSWDGAAETAVVVAAAWLLYARLAADRDHRRLGFIAGDPGVRIARRLYGLAIIPFGLAHFLYFDRTVSMVPSWLPAHVALAAFTGAAFIVAGGAILVGFYARLAAVLSALEIGLVSALVWIPIAAARSLDSFEQLEVAVSAVLIASAWVVAESVPRTLGAVSSKMRRGRAAGRTTRATG